MRTFFFFLCFNAFVHSSETQVPLDREVLTGQLPNGMIYYVRENHFPKDKASLRLVVKVGSIYEEEEERGIAHFLEHLLFRGSSHFKDGEVFRFLESIGSWTGADANAYTGFDSTTFLFDISLAQDRALETTLTILSDFASSATLDSDSIEKERNVVLDELYQDSSSANGRLLKKMIGSFLPHSPYPERFPIGLEKVVKTATPDTLRAFYKKWYRPDRMAIIAVGDFDAHEIVERIEKEFAPLICPEEIVLEPNVNYHYLDEPLAVVHHDPDLLITRVALLSYNPYSSQQEVDIDDFSSGFLTHAALHLFSDRLDRLCHTGSSLLAASVDEFAFSKETYSFYIAAGLYEDHYEEGLRALNQEIKKTLKWGFTPNEWRKCLKQLKAESEKQLANQDKIEHESYAADYVNHFMRGEPLVDKAWYLRHMLTFLENTTVDTINFHLPNTSLADSFKVFFGTSSTEVKNSLNETFLLSIFEEDAEDEAWEDEPQPITFTSYPKFPEGKITQIIEDRDTGVHYWTLGNEIEMAVKHTDFERDQIEICAHATGGLASFSEDDLHSAHFTTEYALLSGLEGIPYLELSDYLTSLGIDCTLKLDDGMRLIRLSAPRKHAEIAFQLLHEIFTSPSFDLIQWQHLTKRAKELFKQMEKDHAHQFMKFVRAINSQDYFYFKSIDLERVSEEKSRALFHRSFGTPQQFHFIVAGDLEETEIETFSKQYLASLPSPAYEPFPSPQLPQLFPQEVICREFKSGHNAFATQLITIPYERDPIYNRFDSSYPFHAACQLLNQRLEMRLRTQLGNTYSAWVTSHHPFYPDFSNSLIEIGFTSQPEHRQHMVELVFEEIEHLKTTLPTQEEIATLQTLFLERKKAQSISNSFWINALLWAKTKQLPLRKALDFETPIAALTPDTLSEAAQMMFVSPYYSILSHLPEDNEP